MEEIKIDPAQMKLQIESEYFKTLVDKSKKGALIGVPWNNKVYDYLFESGLSEEEVNAIMNFSTFEMYLNLEDEEEVF